MPQKRSGLLAIVVNGIIYAIGGEQAVARGFTKAYDPETDTWTQKVNLNNRRMDHSTSAVNGHINIAQMHPADELERLLALYVFSRRDKRGVNPFSRP